MVKGFMVHIGMMHICIIRKCAMRNQEHLFQIVAQSSSHVGMTGSQRRRIWALATDSILAYLSLHVTRP